MKYTLSLLLLYLFLCKNSNAQSQNKDSIVTTNGTVLKAKIISEDENNIFLYMLNDQSKKIRKIDRDNFKYINRVGVSSSEDSILFSKFNSSPINFNNKSKQNLILAAALFTIAGSLKAYNSFKSAPNNTSELNKYYDNYNRINKISDIALIGGGIFMLSGSIKIFK